MTDAAKGGMWSRPLHAIGEEDRDRRPGRWGARGMQARNAVRRALLDVGARKLEGVYMRDTFTRFTRALQRMVILLILGGQLGPGSPGPAELRQSYHDGLRP